MRNFFHFMEKLDRRYLYLLLILFMGLPLAKPIPIRPNIAGSVQAMYDLLIDIEPEPNKIVVIAADFTPDTRPELAPAFKAYLEMLMRKKVKFAVCSVYPEGPPLADQYTESLALKYGYQYGRDWCQWGYIVNLAPWIPAMLRNIPGTVKQDKRGNLINSLPMMKGIQNHENIQAVLIATGSASYQSWAGLAYGPYKIPHLLQVTGVIVQEAQPYYQAGQFQGFSPGLVGANQLEFLINKDSGKELVESPASAMMTANGFGHIMLLIMILLGNIAYFVMRNEPEVRA